MPNLEEMTVDQCWKLYLNNNPPGAGTDRESIQFAKQIYFAGFGSAISIARRVANEEPERRASILQRLIDEVWTFARALKADRGVPH